MDLLLVLINRSSLMMVVFLEHLQTLHLIKTLLQYKLVVLLELVSIQTPLLDLQNLLSTQQELGIILEQ